MAQYASPLQEAAERWPQTQLWNDSCGMADIDLALSHGGCGATSNPVIVANVLHREYDLWKDRLDEIIHKDLPGGTEDEVAWQLIKECALKGAQKLHPLWESSNHQKGWQAIQVNPKFYRSTEKTVAHAVELSSMSDNILIKMPVSTADVKALEECVYRGVSVNGTVCFTISQAVAVAEAIERGYKRREAEGLDTGKLFCSCTIMTGRLDDYMRRLVAKRETPITQEYLDMAGEAVFKKAYKMFHERGYHARLLVANNMSHYLWSRFLGGDCLMTINPLWWRRMNGAKLELHETINEDVPAIALQELLDKIPEFRTAYEEGALKVEDFNKYGAFIHCMTEFNDGCDAFIKYIRGMMMPGSVD